MTRDEVKTFLVRVSGTYSNFKFEGDTTINAWLEIFKATSSDQADKALTAYVQNGGKYAPTPADLLKLVQPEDKNRGIRRYLMHDKFTGADFIRQYNEDGSQTDLIVKAEVAPGGRKTGGWIYETEDVHYIFAAQEES